MPMFAPIRPADLLPGDVLLGHDAGPIGRAIFRADGVAWPVDALKLDGDGLVDAREAGFSHAMLWLGTDRLGEASRHGVTPNTLAGAIVLNNLDAILVRRPLVTDVGAILAQAELFLSQGDRYAYGQLVLLDRVCRQRRRDVRDAEIRRYLTAQIEREAARVRRWQSCSHEPMICSEFVYRCFTEAAVPYPVAVPLFRDDPVPVSGEPVTADIVTPGDLWLTPSFSTVGRLVA
jgi:hypothetical protein